MKTDGVTEKGRVDYWMSRAEVRWTAACVNLELGRMAGDGDSNGVSIRWLTVLPGIYRTGGGKGYSPHLLDKEPEAKKSKVRYPLWAECVL